MLSAKQINLFLQSGFLILLLPLYVPAQKIDSRTCFMKVEKDNSLRRKKNSIEVSNAPFFFINEKSVLYAITAKYSRIINISRFDIGLAYEKVFDVHDHNTVGIAGTFRPSESLQIGVMPGFTYMHTNMNSPFFGIHVETAYGFQLNNLQIGPYSEVGYNEDAAHVSIGLKTGYRF